MQDVYQSGTSVKLTGAGDLISEMGAELMFWDGAQWRDLNLPGSRLGSMASAANQVLVRPQYLQKASVRVEPICQKSELTWFLGMQEAAEHLVHHTPDEAALAASKSALQNAPTPLTQAYARHFYAINLYARNEPVTAEAVLLQVADQWHALKRIDLKSAATFTASHLANLRSDFQQAQQLSRKAEEGFLTLSYNYMLQRSREMACRKLWADGKLGEHIACLSGLIDEYQKLGEFPDELSLRIDRLIAQRELGNTNELKTLIELEPKLPNDPNFLIIRGRLWLQAAQIARDHRYTGLALRYFDQAEQAFAGALRDGERWRVNVAIQQANMLSELGLYSQATTLLLPILKRIDVKAVPARAAAVLVALGRVKTQAGQPIEAANWFDKAAQIQAMLGIAPDVAMSKFLATEAKLARIGSSQEDELKKLGDVLTDLPVLSKPMQSRRFSALATIAVHRGDLRIAKRHLTQAKKLAANDLDRNYWALAESETLDSMQVRTFLAGHLGDLFVEAERSNPTLAYLNVRQASAVREKWMANETNPARFFDGAVRSEPSLFLRPTLALKGNAQERLFYQLARDTTPQSSKRLFLPSLKQLQQKLKPGERIFYLIGAEPHSFALWISTDSIRLIKLAGKQTLEQLVEKTNRLLQDRTHSHTTNNELFDALFGQIEEPAPEQLYIIPSEISLRIPFSAALWPKGVAPLIETSSTSYITFSTSASTPNNTISFFAPADFQTELAFAQREKHLLIDVASRNGMKINLHVNKIGKTDFINALMDRKWLHFSSHGASNPTQFGASGIWLGKEDDSRNFISWLDLVGVESNAELLVLNACHTADGGKAVDQTTLSFALITATSGSKHVVAASWPLSDTASGVWVPAFYQALGTDLNQTGQALRQAQLALRRSPHFKHPYYWASLVHFKQLSFPP